MVKGFNNSPEKLVCFTEMLDNSGNVARDMFTILSAINNFGCDSSTIGESFGTFFLRFTMIQTILQT